MSATIMFRHAAYEVSGVVVVAVAPRRRELRALMISVDWKIALDLAQQRDQGGGLQVGKITPEHGVKGLRDRPKPVEERFAACR